MEDSILLPNTGANHALPMFCFHGLFLGLMLIYLINGNTELTLRTLI